jgi:hypothetical protein
LEKEQGGSLTLPDFKTYVYITIVSKSVTVAKDRQTDQWNRAENPKVDSHKYGQLNFFIFILKKL